MEKKILTPEDIREKLATLGDIKVTFFDDMGALPFENKNSFQTEFYALLLCIAGKATCRIGDVDYEIGPGDLFINHPRQFIENAMASIDFKYQGLIVAPQYLENIFQLGGNIWNAKFVAQHHPVVHLEPEEMERAMRNNEFIRLKLNGPQIPHRNEMLQMLFHSLFLEFYDMLAPKLPLMTYNYTAAESLFGRFISLVEVEVPQQREVKYFADKLCVSAKYLSSVCKNSSGKTASEIINGRTIDYIKRELRLSSKSVKQVASDAGFENLSFFGKYVRRELGVSPREYRAQSSSQAAAEE